MEIASFFPTYTKLEDKACDVLSSISYGVVRGRSIDFYLRKVRSRFGLDGQELLVSSLPKLQFNEGAVELYKRWKDSHTEESNVCRGITLHALIVDGIMNRLQHITLEYTPTGTGTKDSREFLLSDWRTDSLDISPRKTIDNCTFPFMRNPTKIPEPPSMVSDAVNNPTLDLWKRIYFNPRHTRVIDNTLMVSGNAEMDLYASFTLFNNDFINDGNRAPPSLLGNLLSRVQNADLIDRIIVAFQFLNTDNEIFTIYYLWRMVSLQGDKPNWVPTVSPGLASIFPFPRDRINEAYHPPETLHSTQMWDQHSNHFQDSSFTLSPKTPAWSNMIIRETRNGNFGLYHDMLSDPIQPRSSALQLPIVPISTAQQAPSPPTPPTAPAAPITAPMPPVSPAAPTTAPMPPVSPAAPTVVPAPATPAAPTMVPAPAAPNQSGAPAGAPLTGGAQLRQMDGPEMMSLVQSEMTKFNQKFNNPFRNSVYSSIPNLVSSGQDLTDPGTKQLISQFQTTPFSQFLYHVKCAALETPALNAVVPRLNAIYAAMD
jgi:hypothetical protein